MIIKNNTRIL